MNFKIFIIIISSILLFNNYHINAQNVFIFRDLSEIIGLEDFTDYKIDSIKIQTLKDYKILSRKDLIKVKRLQTFVKIGNNAELKGTITSISDNEITFKLNNGTVYFFNKNENYQIRFEENRLEYGFVGLSVLNPSWVNLVLGVNLTEDVGLRVSGNPFEELNKGYQVDLYVNVLKNNEFKLDIGACYAEAQRRYNYNPNLTEKYIINYTGLIITGHYNRVYFQFGSIFEINARTSQNTYETIVNSIFQFGYTFPIY